MGVVVRLYAGLTSLTLTSIKSLVEDATARRVGAFTQ